MPQTSESRMAKMKKKISSPLVKRRNLSGGKLISTLPLIVMHPKNKRSAGIMYGMFIVS